MNDGRLVILAGGISSRMKKPTKNQLQIDSHLVEDANKKSKSMIGVGKNYRPFLDYLLYNARESGYSDIVIVIGERDSSIRDYYGPEDTDNDFNGLKISYAVQPIPSGRTKPFGTADALMWGLKSKKDWEGKKFTVCNSDNLYSQKALKLMLNSEYPGALIDYNREALEFEHSRIERFAITIKNKEGFLTNIIEKPSSELIKQVFEQDGYVGVSMNIFSLDYNLILPILEQIKPNPVRDEKELPDAVKTLADQINNSVFAFPFAEHVPDLTSKDDIQQVKNYLEKYYYNLKF
jgi:glucose-1-phosphate adenylyltransferase